MRVLLIGTLNAEILAQQLRYYGVNAQTSPKIPHPFFYRRFDIVYGVGLLRTTTIFSVKFLRKRCVVHAVGSDVLEYVNAGLLRRKVWNFALQKCDEILYVSKGIQQAMGLERGKIIPIPIDTRLFSRSEPESRKRDVLYYCPNPKIYKLKWILKYAKEHPNEKITVLGQNRPISIPNVKVCPSVPYHRMPTLYDAHLRLIRMTTHDGFPKMPYEALLCGLEVFWNGQRITKVPKQMLMENTIPQLIAILKSLK